MATIRDNWDLRAGFTKDYDLATSAVKEADKQFAAAQDIVKSAYALDKTAATQGGEIERMNQENLEKLLVSQEKVGDFESNMEIQRALESVGDPYIENPEDLPPVQQDRRIVTEDGKVMDDPTAPVDTVKNAARPPAPVAQRRPMTNIERLKAIEPMIASPRAKLALRQRIQTAATEEARQLANVAPDEAFNGLIKNGVIRGNPLVANDDGTYTRVMPDGKNQIRLDRNEAAAWVGDVINKTNEQYKLIESRRKLGEESKADIEVDTAKINNRMALSQEEARLKSILQSQQAGFEDRNVRIRASVGQYGEGGGSGGGRTPTGTSLMDEKAGLQSEESQGARVSEGAQEGNGGANTSEAPRSGKIDLDKISLQEIDKYVESQREVFNKAKANGNADLMDRAQRNMDQLKTARSRRESKLQGQGKRLTGQINALETLIANSGLSSGERNKLLAEATRLTTKYGMAQKKGEQVDMATFQGQYDDLLAKIRGAKKTGDKK